MGGREPALADIERALRKRSFATLSTLTEEGRPHAAGEATGRVHVPPTRLE